MKNNRRVHPQWSSWQIYVLAASGSAVGLGNIWKFPYIAGMYGGGAFVLVYLLSMLLIGVPIMMAETMIGRAGRRNPVTSLETLAKEVGADPRWRWLGMMSVLAGFLILSYYSVIAGWTLAYVFKMAIGSFIGQNSEDVGRIFAEFVTDPAQQLIWHTVFMSMTMMIVARGVQGGLEKAVELMTPVLFFILLILVGYAMGTGKFEQGVTFLFALDFSKLSKEGVLVAMGHAFFSLSIAMGAMMVYGSYLPNKVSIAKTSFIVAGADTAVALMAGLAIFPLVFANHLPPSSGPGLIFLTLPLTFAGMPGGTLFGALFFVLLLIAALSSSISLIEPAVIWLVESYELNRRQACFLSGLLCWTVGLGTVFSFNLWQHVTLFDMTFFGVLDFVTSNLILPLGGLLIALFVGWIMRDETIRAEWLSGSYAGTCWRWLIRYPVPGGVALVFLEAVGVL